jgi:5'-nucleotidase
LADYEHDADFSHTTPYIRQIIDHALANPLPQHLALNVNFPKKSESPIKGVKTCRQALARWQEEFDQRKDPRGRSYFWLTGSFVNLDAGTDTDEWALANNYVSIVPCTFDLTAYHAMTTISRQFDGIF